MISDKLLAKIQEIAELKDGWNGYDSKPIDYNVIENIRAILNCLPFEPEIFPTGRNSIQLEYFSDCDKNGIEIEVFVDSALYDLIRGGNYIIEDEAITIEDSIALLLDFYFNWYLL